MTHWKSLSPGDYLTAAEFNGRTPTFTIKEVKGVMMPVLKDKDAKAPAGPEKDEAKEKEKGVVYFNEIDRGWVFNKTTGACMEAMFGAHVEGWVGKRVTLHAVEVQVGRKKDLGIRVVGSPDLERPVKATISLPRKRPVDMMLVPTGKPAPAERAPGQEG